MSNTSPEIAVLAECNAKLLAESEVLWGVVGALIESHPNKSALASAIRESAERLLELWADQPTESLAIVAARVNQMLEACGESPGNPKKP